MLRYLTLFFLLLPTIALAEESYFYKTVDRQKLPAEINIFLDRENTCYVLHDQPAEWDDDQKKAAENARCYDLGCTRTKLLKKHLDAHIIKVIKEYNASLWQTDLIYDENVTCP